MSIDFQDEIQEAKQISKEVEASPPPSDRPRRPTIPLTEANARLIAIGLKPTSSGLDMSYYREIAQSDPTLELAGLRIEIEVLANNLATGFKLEPKKTEPITSLLRRLNAEQDHLRVLTLCGYRTPARHSGSRHH